MDRHVNIPIFIPHLGCPNDCVFCNQRFISGVTEFDIGSVKRIIDESLATVDPRKDTVEIAFFGGSFTGIDRHLMISLLEIAYSYVSSGAVSSIRCSTRPDYIDDEILEILKHYKVTTIELGFQSVSERVLSASKRGHGFSDEERAARLIVDGGFELVGQMMIGLPSATLEDEIQTARFISSCGASAARIYPTVVFHSTELKNMTERREYKPLSLAEAVERCAKAYLILEEAGVRVIRVGLHSSENLSQDTTYFAGPNHPAIGELVENRLFFEKIKSKFIELSIKSKSITVYVPRGAISKAQGHKRQNKLQLIEEFALDRLCFKESDSLSGRNIFVVEEGN